MADYPLIDQASLLMVPSATKEGKLYSQLPTDGSGDFTFTRATSATRVNEEGYIEKGYENLLLQSNTFDTTWSATNASVTSGQSGYDGSTDAWLLSKIGANGRVRQTISQSGVNTFSLYVKSGTSDWTAIVCGSGTAAYFDLSNGTKGNLGSSAITSSITSVGNGWYRCSVSVNISATFVDIYVADSDGVVSGTSGSIYIQDGMLNQGLVAYPYLETTTTPVYGGLSTDQPRLDYTDASCPSVLIEPSSTNLLKHSEYFEGAGWSSEGSNGVTITANQTTSPEGLINAFKIQGGGASNDRLEYRLTVFPSNSALYSVFVKGNGEATTIRLFNTRTGDRIEFDVSEEGVVTFDNSSGVSNYDVENYNNGWYRVWGEFEMTQGATNYFQLYPTLTGTESIYIYGAQAELGSSPTSYIPTYGSAQTRAAETLTATKTLPSEGTLYINVGGTTQPKLSVLGEFFDASTTENKVAIAYSATALKISHNGSIVLDKTGTYDVSSLTEIDLGHDGGTDQADTSIEELVTFGSFLTTTELNALTQ